ncbi:hypothetical protein [Taibaiella soli]|uniref:Uncharacterized protein n=1 Tax=Taibaiella soli TaxID=1649169 RepID=A0A2W2AN05_9BACT|nr:hypothetical protein [Taibaiella soli]PZF73710.1 hypothetical protein DN068_06860 [Taibaiella soli]
MSRKARFAIALILVFTYFLIKYAMRYEHSKFDQGFSFVVIPLIYFVPAFLFVASAYLLSLSLPQSRRAIQTILAIVISIGACAFVHSFYDGLTIGNYFEALNTGYSFPKAEDFRLEYFILLLGNLGGFIFFTKKNFSGDVEP